MPVLDWSTVLVGVPVLHPEKLSGGFLCNYDSDGELVWEKEKALHVDAGEEEGSASRVIQLRASSFYPPYPVAESGYTEIDDRNLYLYLSGNLTKWLQGHNCAGVSASYHTELLLHTLYGLNKRLEFCDWEGNDCVYVRRYRKDVTVSVRLGSQQAVHDWLRAAPSHVVSRHRHDLRSQQDTVYWGKNSRRWSIKAYSKCTELQARQKNKKTALPLDLYNRLLQWSEGIVRIELCLRHPELKKIGPVPVIDESYVWQYWDRLSVGESTMDRIDMSGLGTVFAGTLARWQMGYDLKRELPHRTYYRHRREIKRVTGVDIGLPSPTSETKKKADARSVYSREYLQERVDNGKGIEDTLYDPNQIPLL